MLISFQVGPKGDENVKNEKVPSIHHISVLGGPILATSVASVYCLIPQHNILKEPCYWYEFHLCAGAAVIPFFHGLFIQIPLNIGPICQSKIGGNHTST